MLEQSVRQAILELQRRGQGVRAIARALHVSRAAVRDVLRRGSAEVPRLVRPEKALEHREDILRLLRECEGSFTRVHEELTHAGLQLSYPAFTAFRRRHGIGQAPKQAAGHYDFAPGQEMQHDTSAGCSPEHLPLLIAAVRCLAEPKMYLRNKAMSTGPHAPLVLVNGPRGRAARLNSGICALGPGAPSASKTVLGRALRLTMMNVGHTYVGVSDMDTIGSPLKYSLCCAENERESPWEPYHVSRGFDREASAVTVHFAYGMCELHDFKSTTPEGLVEVFATAANNVAQVGTGLWLTGRRADPRYKTEEKEHNTLLICPEHAQVFARERWGRREIQEALYRLARLPFRTMMLNKERKAMAIAHPELGWLGDHPELPVPVVESPECFDIAVVGGAAGRGAYFCGAGEPVTMPVDE